MVECEPQKPRVDVMLVAQWREQSALTCVEEGEEGTHTMSPKIITDLTWCRFIFSN